MPSLPETGSLPAPNLQEREVPKCFVPPVEPLAQPIAPQPPASVATGPESGWRQVVNGAGSYTGQNKLRVILLPALMLSAWMFIGSVTGLPELLTPLSMVVWDPPDGPALVLFLGGAGVLLVMMAFFASFYRRAAQTSFMGLDVPPRWPGGTEFCGDLHAPLSILMAWGVSCVPLLVYHYFFPCDKWDDEVFDVKALALDWVGTVFFSAAAAGLVMQGGLWRGIRSILRTAGKGAWPGLLLAGSLLFVGRVVAGLLLPHNIFDPLPGVPLACLLLTWLLVFHARLVGVVCRMYEPLVN